MKIVISRLKTKNNRKSGRFEIIVLGRRFILWCLEENYSLNDFTIVVNLHSAPDDLMVILRFDFPFKDRNFLIRIQTSHFARLINTLTTSWIFLR